MRVGKKNEAVQSFDKAIHYYPGNLEVLLEYVGFLEYFDVKSFIKINLEIQKLLENEDNSRYRSAEIYNNIAVMYVKEGF